MSQAARPESKPMMTIPPGAKSVSVKIDGKPMTVPEGTTIWDAAASMGVDIPVLCHTHDSAYTDALRISVPDLPY